MSSHTALPIEPLDVLIIGAGVSGIGAAAYLRRHQPHKVFAILESRERMGGTWDLFRYPGIRSDSDLYTFGFDFKPWTKAKSLADAADILEYLREAVAEYQLDPFIQYRQKVVSANWQSDKGLWAVCVEDGHTAETRTIECRWLFSAGGYYRYDQGFSPRFEGAEQFKGQIIHPQHWPERLDYRGKHVVVIGSGATAVTLIPAMADEVASITMLQRTPSYIVNQPANDSVAAFLRKILPAQTAYSLTRYKNAKITLVFWRFCQRFPGLARKLLIWLTRRELPKGYPVDVHFNPPYKPWDQRCGVAAAAMVHSFSPAARLSARRNRRAPASVGRNAVANGRCADWRESWSAASLSSDLSRIPAGALRCRLSWFISQTPDNPAGPCSPLSRQPSAPARRTFACNSAIPCCSRSV